MSFLERVRDVHHPHEVRRELQGVVETRKSAPSLGLHVVDRLDETISVLARPGKTDRVDGVRSSNDVGDLLKCGSSQGGVRLRSGSGSQGQG